MRAAPASWIGGHKLSATTRVFAEAIADPQSTSCQPRALGRATSASWRCLRRSACPAHRYDSGPVRGGLGRRRAGRKPFSQWWEEPAWPAGGMRVFNTGGWVVDHAAPQPLQGGAVVLVSDDLDVVSLRIYQQVGTPSSQAITVETVRPTPGGEAFAAHVRSLVSPEAEPWSTFVAAVDELVSERRDAMRMILEGELELLRE